MSEPVQASFHTRRGEFSLDARFTIPGQGVTALFGHSGSGKSTILRCIAGLEPEVEGILSVDGMFWQSTGTAFLPAHKRAVGYVFQDANLFAHLSVEKNIEFGLKRIAPSQQNLEKGDVVEMLGIAHLLKRSVTHLSGGEKQRVAIARALLASPQLLLMDEPLAALDDKSKSEILPYLEQLHEQLSIPVIYVSHSLKEVSRLADHLVWLDQGEVKAQGPLQQVLAEFDLATSHGDDAGEVIETTVLKHDDPYHLTCLSCGCGQIWVKRIERAVGSQVRVHIPARDVSITLEHSADSSIQNIWPVVVEEISEANQGQVILRLKCAEQGGLLLSRITQRSLENLGLKPGSHCFAQIKSVGLLE